MPTGRTLEAKNSATCGRATVLSFGERTRLVEAQGDDSCPETITCNITQLAEGTGAASPQITGPGGYTGTPAIRLIASVQWGAGGGSSSAWVSVRRGVVLTLIASSVQIDVMHQGETNDLSDAPGSNPIRVIAGVAYGGSPARSPVTAPVYETLGMAVGAATSATFPIPAYSVFFTLIPHNEAEFLGPANLATVDMLDRTGAIVAQYTPRVHRTLTELPIPGNALQVRVSRALAPGLENFTGLFGLCL